MSPSREIIESYGKVKHLIFLNRRTISAERKAELFETANGLRWEAHEAVRIGEDHKVFTKELNKLYKQIEKELAHD